MVVEAGLNELFEGNHFDICRVRNLARIVGARDDGPAFDQLHVLHCMNYSRMRPELREVIPHLVAEVLKGGQRLQPATDFVLNEITTTESAP